MHCQYKNIFLQIYFTYNLNFMYLYYANCQYCLLRQTCYDNNKEAVCFLSLRLE
ncbi:hypothetical protein ANACOL_04020 [Anaerotruncus colihominis DSM 17241]|uniref:Uncharacterized protein n=1 Tax=Anaerotruncus colihominis DSM 17241 TaxID=445972 RepID=B0PH00_9FIRM|nr:hypothetical protein ANACOL_04020 [Anaerotruncus colihominis DSM 17241]